MTLVIDASAAVEYLLKTALGEQVGRLLAEAELAAPELLDIEVSSRPVRSASSRPRAPLFPSASASALDRASILNLHWHVIVPDALFLDTLPAGQPGCG